MMNLGATAFAGLLAGVTGGSSIFFADSLGRVRPVLPAVVGGVVRVMTVGGPEVRLLPMAVDAGGSFPPVVTLAVVSLSLRTGGAVTTFPGAVARAVGVTSGCGITCAAESCCAETRTAWRATGCPPRNAVVDTAVVATLRFT